MNKNKNRRTRRATRRRQRKTRDTRLWRPWHTGLQMKDWFLSMATVSRLQKNTGCYPAASSTPAETSKGDAKRKQAGHLQLHTSLSQSWNAFQVDFGCSVRILVEVDLNVGLKLSCWPLKHLIQPVSHHFEWHVTKDVEYLDCPRNFGLDQILQLLMVAQYKLNQCRPFVTILQKR